MIAPTTGLVTTTKIINVASTVETHQECQSLLYFLHIFVCICIESASTNNFRLNCSNQSPQSRPVRVQIAAVQIVATPNYLQPTQDISFACLLPTFPFYAITQACCSHMPNKRHTTAGARNTNILRQCRHVYVCVCGSMGVYACRCCKVLVALIYTYFCCY